MKHKNNNMRGFSLLELMIVLALFAILGAFAVPNIFRSRQGAQRKEFLHSFQLLLQDAALRSVLKNSPHQIYIDLVHGTIQTRIFDPASTETVIHKKFKPLIDDQYLTQVPCDDQKHLDLRRFVYKNFYINGVEELTPGNQTLDIVFYIMPDGTSQAIVANLIDQDEDGLEKDVQFSYEINPFYARMSVYDGFQTF